MATPIWLTGFEHGVNCVTSGGGVCDTLTGTAGTNIAVQSTTKRSGNYALRVYPSSAAAHIGRSISSTVTVTRFYVRFASTPSADHVICRIMTAAQQLLFSYQYNSGSPRFAMTVNSGTPQYSAAGSVTTGVWYRVDIRFDTSTGTSTIDWQIDGTAMTQATRSVATATQTVFNIGVTTAATADFYIDDLMVGYTSGDYPFGAGSVVALWPNADGTHNNASNIMEDSSGNDIDGSTYTAYDKLDEDPLGSNANTDRVQQTANGTGNYCEVQFGDTTKSTINGVCGMVAYQSASALANTAATVFRRYNAGTPSDHALYGIAGALTDYSETSTFYKYAYCPAPSGGWTMDEVNALRMRFGYAGDANPDIYWLGLMLEVDGPDDILLVPDQTGYQTQLGDEATLGVTIDMAPDLTGYQEQVGDEATLGVTIDLVPDGTGYQEHVGDNAVLDVSTEVNLLTDEGYQEQVGDLTTLATELKHTVAPSGGDFESLDAALDHLRASHPNLVTANVFALISIEGAWSAVDSVYAGTEDITTDYAHPLIIRADANNRASAQGWRTDRYRLSVEGGQALGVRGSYGANRIIIDGLQIESYNRTGTSQMTIDSERFAAGSTAELRNCRVRLGLAGTSDTGFCYGLGDNDAAILYINCIAERHPSYPNGSARGYYLGGPSAGATKVLNCLGVNLAYVYRDASTGGISIHDSIAFNCDDDFYNPASFYEFDNCASDDNEGSNNIAESGGGTWWPNDFVDAANGDYRLKPTSNLVGAGSGAGAAYFTDDIDGQTRSDWDVGPHESVDVTLAPAEGVQTQLGDEATLEVTGGTVDLVPDQTGYQEQVGDETALGVTIDLVPDSTGFQTQLGDEATVTVGAIELITSEGSQDQVGDEATIESIVDLVPDSTGAHTQFGDEATLALVAIDLIPDEGYQLQAGDDVSLGVTIDLIADGTGAQTQFGDNTTIEVGIVALVPDEGSQDQSGDEAVLGVTIALVPAEGAQEQTGDNAVLDVPAFELVPSEGVQTQAGDEVALTQVHNLQADEGSQEQSGDEATVNIGVAVAPDDGSQEQTGDSPTLIMGVLTTYEFVDRLLLSDRVAKRRLVNNVERVNVHSKVKTHRIGRFQ